MIDDFDNWVVIQIKDPLDDKIAGWKILGGWSGGYADGDSWRMNSGVKDWEEHDDHYLFHGYSGSTYKVQKNRETVRMNIAGVIRNLENTGKASWVDVRDFKEDWEKIHGG